ncbi:MAG: protoheme IX farnesyltransferase [Armatimonadetes bacterium]|nr:MAG: protoheme IX farnesyltransferase [Armatimonadota bacterium]
MNPVADSTEKTSALAACSTTRPAARVRDYLQLAKPRVTTLVWVSMAAGMGIASAMGAGTASALTWLHALVGGFFVIASANAFNQALEAERDAVMRRTADRPVPGGRVTREEAFGVAAAFGLAGLTELALFVNLPTAALGLLSIVLYAFAYTPLKPRSHLCTLVGAIPGAIPPLAGWVAVTGGLGLPGLLLFAVQFLWQFPHFWAIAWLNREDYSRAGFRMLPYPEATAAETARQCVRYSLALVPVSAGFAVFAQSAGLYLILALGLAFWMVRASLAFRRLGDKASARRLLRVTIAYLPLILLVMLLSAK